MMVDLSWLPAADEKKENDPLSFLPKKGDAAQSAIDIGSRMDPDAEARRQTLVEETGAPMPLVRQQEDKILKLRDKPTINDLADSPRTRAFFESLPNAAVAHDDHKSLTRLEKLWDDLGRGKGAMPYLREIGGNIKKSWGVGKQTVELGKMYNQKLTNIMRGERDPLLEYQIGVYNRQLKASPEDENVFESILTGGTEMSPLVIDSIIQGQAYGLEFGAIAFGVGMAVNPPMARKLATKFYTGGVKFGMLRNIFMIESGLAFKEFEGIQDENGVPLDPKIAGIAALTVGAANATLEQWGLSQIPGADRVLGRVGKSQVALALKSPTVRKALMRVAGKYAWGISANAMQEAAQEATVIIAREIAKETSNKLNDTNFRYTAEDLGPRMWESFKEGAAGAAFLGVPGSAVNLSIDVGRSAVTQDFKEDSVKFNQAINESKILKRSPAATKRFLDMLGAGDDVYIDSVFYQSDPGKAAPILEKLGVTPEKAQEAIDNGHDIPVGYSVLNTKLSPEEYNTVIDDVKPAPGALTTRDVNAIDLNKEVEKVSGQLEDERKTRLAVSRETARIRKEGIRAGYSPQEMKDHTDSLKRFAEYAGYDQKQTIDFLKKPKLRRATGPSPGAMAQEGKVSIDTPEFKTWFGKSKVVDETGAPLQVYHGTHETGISAFEPDENGNIFLTTSIETAASYGEQQMPLYVSMQNPLVVDAKGQSFKDVIPSFYVDEAKAKGYDGVIVKNIRDDATYQYEGDTIVSWKPEQIKSVKNTGAWSRETPNILFQADVTDPEKTFYSQLRSAVESPKFSKNISAKEAIRTIENWTADMGEKKVGFLKKDEVLWSGVLDWLAKKEGRVTKDMILNYLADNAVEIEIKDIKDFGEEKPDFWEDEAAFDSAWESFTEDFNSGDFEDSYKDRVKEIIKDAWKDEDAEVWKNLSWTTKLEYLDNNDIEDDARQKFIDDVIEAGIKTARNEISYAWADPGTYFKIWDQIQGDKEAYLMEYGNAEAAFDEFEEDVKQLDIQSILGMDKYDEIRDEIWENVAHEYLSRAVEDAEENWLAANTEGETKWEQYTVKGPHEDYQEILFIWDKNLEDAYVKKSHWNDIENFFAHARIDRRKTVDGKNILFINEMQSDWEADLKDEGEKGKWKVFLDRELYGMYDNADDARAVRDRLHAEYPRKGDKYTTRVAMEGPHGGFAAMPFRSNWRQVALKALVRMAAEEGLDGIGWTTGAQQMVIYPNVSHMVDKVSYNEMTETLYYHRKDQSDPNRLEKKEDVPPRQVKKYIGKESADKLFDKEEVDDLKTIEGPEIVFGGHGLRAMYDKIIPSEFKRFFDKKQWGYPKVEKKEIETGYIRRETPLELTEEIVGRAEELARQDSNYVADQIVNAMIKYNESGAGSLSIDMFDGRARYWVEYAMQNDMAKEKIFFAPITPEIKEKAVTEGFPLFQKEGEGKPPRGALLIGNNQYIIELFQKADRSTIWHETAHIYFNEIKSAVESGAAPERIAEDYGKIRKWLDLAEGEEFTTAHQETFARGFEAYLWEGKAPNAEMAGVFQRFKTWLRSVYKRVQELNVTLNDDIRGVFDRMLTDGRRVEESAILNGFTMPDKAHLDTLGVVAEDRNYMQRLIKQAYDKAEIAMVADRDKNRRAQMKKWRALVDQEIEEDPVYKFVDALSGGEGLNRAIIANEYGEDTVAKMPPRTVKAGGLNPAEGLPDMFASVDDMIEALSNLPTKKEYKKMRLDALAASHDAKYLPVDYLASTKEFGAFYEILAKYSDRDNRGVTPRRAFTLLAEKKISQASIRDATRLDKYLSAMKKFSRIEADKASQGKWDEAADANEKMRMNYEFARQSVKIRKEVEKAHEKLKNLAKAKTIERRWQNAIKDTAMRFNLPSSAPIRPASETIPTLLSFLTDITEIGDNSAAFSDFIIDERFTTDYRNLTVDQFRELRDLFSFLEIRGRDAQNDYLSDHKTKRAEVVDKSVAESEGLDRRRTWERFGYVRNLSEFKRQYFAMEDSLPFITIALGGYQDIGWKGKYSYTQEIIEGRLRDARREETRLLYETWQKATPHIDQILKGIKRLRKKYGRRIMLPGVNVPAELVAAGQRKGILPEQIFAIVHNLGNDSNRARLYNGYEDLKESDVEAWMDLLEKEDFDAIQGLWDTYESLYPALNELYKRKNGRDLKKIEAVPLQTKFGEYRGGYTPAVYDKTLFGSKSQRVAKFNEEETMRARTEALYQVPVTKSSMEKGRLEGVRLPLLLDMSVAGTHIRDTVHHITHDEAVRDIYKIISSDKFTRNVQTLMGPEVYDVLKKALKHVASPEIKENDWLAKVVRKMRPMTSAYILGHNLSVAYKQWFSSPGAIFEIGGKDYLKAHLHMFGLKDVISGTGIVLQRGWFTKYGQILELSEFMRDRANAIDNDAQRKIGYLKPDNLFSSKTIDFLRELSFIWIRSVDAFTVMPIWHGALKRGLRQLDGDLEKAIKYADRVVEKSQPVATPMDLNQWQRGDKAKIFAMFSTYMTAKKVQRQKLHWWAMKHKKLSKTGFAFQTFLEHILPVTLISMLTAALWGRGMPWGDEDDEDKLTWEEIGRESVKYYLFAGHPVMQEVVSPFSDPFDTPLVTSGEIMKNVAEDIFKIIDEVSAGEVEDETIKKIMWDIFETGSLLSGSALSRPVEKFMKGAEQEGGPQKYLFPKPKKYH